MRDNTLSTLYLTRIRGLPYKIQAAPLVICQGVSDDHVRKALQF